MVVDRFLTLTKQCKVKSEKKDKRIKNESTVYVPYIDFFNLLYKIEGELS